VNEGYWIQKNSGKYWRVPEHCVFVKSPAGADAMGLPDSVREKIQAYTCDFSGPGREQILIDVMKAGYIRMRGHGAQYSFEFYGDTVATLWVILEFCQQMAGPFTWITINNLKSNEQFASNFQDFEARMKHDESEVLRVATVLVSNPAKG